MQPTRSVRFRLLVLVASLALTRCVYAQVPDAFNPGSDARVNTMAIQNDGRIVVGGAFTQVQGQQRLGIARINTDGSLDQSFRASADGVLDTNYYVAEVRAFGIQPDGKILVGGYFTNFCGQPVSGFGRLNSDGTLDSSFDAGLVLDTDWGPGQVSVNCIALQADGKILVGGDFTSAGGTARTNIVRLNADGSVDQTFQMTNELYNAVECMVIQPNGKIVIGGGYTLSRLNANGTIDGTMQSPQWNNYNGVRSLTLQPDGKILCGVTMGSTAPPGSFGLLRFKTDGTLDVQFTNPSPTDSTMDATVSAIGLQVNGSVFAVSTAYIASAKRTYLQRYTAAGAVDSTFRIWLTNGMYAAVDGLALQQDGKLAVGGEFDTIAGAARTNIARLSNPGASESLSYANSTITWLRSGTGPEVWRTTFEVSSNGVNWTGLGAGTRIAGGWQLAAASVPAGSTIRARGFVQNGVGCWLVEKLLAPPPVITTQPASQIAALGGTATFGLKVSSQVPVSYQWRFNGTNIVGATSGSFSINNVQGRDAGSYSVVVRNSGGAVVSSNALLRIAYRPVITTQPLNQAVVVGANANFTVSAAGLGLCYQWRFNGADISGATTSALRFPVQDTNAGSYSVLVTNLAGTVLSTNAILSVLHKPVIICQPVSQGAKIGGSATFAVTADGTMPLYYQWRLNGTNLVARTSSALSLRNIQPTNAGNYSVVVRNAGGWVVSSNAALVLCSYSVSTNCMMFTAAGGVGSLNVSANGVCSWTISNSNSWISIQSATNASGSQSVSFLVDSNPLAMPRTGNMFIAEKLVTVIQDGTTAPDSVAGRTLILDPTNSTGVLTNGKSLVVFAPGTNYSAIWLMLTNRSGSTNGGYEYSRSDASTGTILTGIGMGATLAFGSPSTGSYVLTNAAGDTQLGTFSLEASAPDFNADGQGDFVLQNTNWSTKVWRMNGGVFIGENALSSSFAGWRVFGQADFNADGSTDIAVQNATGKIALFLMNGFARIDAVTNYPVATGWRAFAVADINGDNQPDILLQAADGRVVAWLFDGTVRWGALTLKTAGVGWRAMAAGDFDGDGQNDILLQYTDGRLAIWHVKAGLVTSAAIVSDATTAAKNLASGWYVRGVMDIDYDGWLDLLLQYSDGRLAVWRLKQGVYQGVGLLRNPGPGWLLTGPR